MSSITDDLAAAAKKLREADSRRKHQRDYLDHLVAQAQREGVGWADIKRATGMHNRSLQLSIRRASNPKEAS